VRLEGAQATEAALRAQARGKRLVHVATHGYVREDTQAGFLPSGRGAWSTVAEERRMAAGHDPLLLSGLALAGANPRRGGGEDDGLLTALEASRLDLEGVELVALSACETARGTSIPGEGVLGLVQSFQGAGAARVLASLWKVDDEATRLLMGDFYARWLDAAAPAAPAQALRAAARALRDRAPGAEPSPAPLRLWAAFVLYGR
jgi:CHAT domain-containing protein